MVVLVLLLVLLGAAVGVGAGAGAAAPAVVADVVAIAATATASDVLLAVAAASWGPPWRTTGRAKTPFPRTAAPSLANPDTHERGSTWASVRRGTIPLLLAPKITARTLQAQST